MCLRRGVSRRRRARGFGSAFSPAIPCKWQYPSQSPKGGLQAWHTAGLINSNLTTSRLAPRASLSSDQPPKLAQRPAEIALDVFLVAPIRVVDPLGQSRERQRLEPHAPRSREHGKEQAF